MPAGGSAAQRSAELNNEAEALFELYQHKRQLAQQYRIGANSERDLADVLRPLDVLSWHVLEDRLWPGSKRANVDFLLVGPGGVVAVDAKQWSELEIRNGALFRGDECADDEIDSLHRLGDSLAEGLTDTGLVPAAIIMVMAFTSHDLGPVRVGRVNVLGAKGLVPWLSALCQRLTMDQVERVSSRLADLCPDMSTAEPRRMLLRRPRAPEPRKIEPTGESLIDVEAITQALLDSALAGPIEDWMTFLHPDQNKLIRSHWNGPARVRGPAGTGKTVVGLHRAVHLAERSPHPILFTSYVKTLPIVLASLARRLSENAAENIEFIGVHALAARALEMTGQKITLNPPSAHQAFRDAWRETDAAKHLGPIDERAAYWQEEIDHVIKGRGLTRWEEYRDLVRVGRKTRIRSEQREPVWDLFLAYEAALEKRGIKDFNDLLLRARSSVETFPDLFRYGGVIVDEVQDLNLAAIRFLLAIAGDGPNRLLLIGDGQQSVYPGGFTLAEAGLNVAGRGTVLRVNYRNTVEILNEAARVVSADEFDDLDGEPMSGSRDTEVPRHGYAPIKVHTHRPSSLEAALVSQIRRTREILGVPWGDVAVLVERTRDVTHYKRLLTSAGIPTIELTRYDGVTVDQVKVGTFKRAKGLDFKYVLMPGMRTDPPEVWPGETDASYAERCERLRRELFVGMTRARDGLWLGYLVKAEVS